MKKFQFPSISLKFNKRRTLKNTPENYAYLYYGMFVVCALLYIGLGMLTRGDAVRYSFFYVYSKDYTLSTDMFMDFFNSVRDASHNGGYELNVIYPPLANLLYYAIGKMFKPDLVSASFGDRFDLRNNDPIALLVYFISITLCVFAVYLIIDRYLQRCNFKSAPAALGITSALSYPMLCAIQRGNIIILVIPLTMYFVFFRNHEKKLVRELSYIALALAAGLKIYPAVFGILLITDKKYKEAVRLIIYGIIAFVLPIFAFGGPELLWKLVTNIFGFSKSRSATTHSYRTGYSFQELISLYAPKGLANICGKVVFWCLELMAGLMVFLLRKDWQKLTALCYMVFNLRSLASVYALTFFLIPFILFLTDKRKFRWNDYLYLLCLALMFIPLPCIWYGFLGSIADGSALLNGLSGAALDRMRWALIAHYGAVNKLVSVFAFQGIFLLLIVDVLLTPSNGENSMGQKTLKMRVAELRTRIMSVSSEAQSKTAEVSDEARKEIEAVAADTDNKEALS